MEITIIQLLWEEFMNHCLDETKIYIDFNMIEISIIWQLNDSFFYVRVGFTRIKIELKRK